MIGYQRILAAIGHLPVDRLPVMPITMMFAADHIARPYGQYAADYRVLVEGQIRTAVQYGFDHVSAISDPAREAADCGASVRYFDDQPPAIDEGSPRLPETSFGTLKRPDPLGGGRMHDRVRAVSELRRRVGGQLMIEGWVEGPCAESADLRGINNLMMDFGDEPAFVQDLFAWCGELACAFALAQVQAGADIIGIGDAAASLVGPAIYQEFVWPAEKKLIDAIHAMGAKVRLHICGNTTPLLADIGRLGADIVDIDYPVSLAAARAAMPAQVLLGNIDPVRVLRAGPAHAVTSASAACHQQAGNQYVAAAGCEIPRDTPSAHVEAMVGYAKTHGASAVEMSS
jgi:MtaA/CmuA family methyltransferase